MLPDVRRLLIALVLACSGVVLAQMPAHACKCADSSVQRDANRADVVFSGVVVDRTQGTLGERDREATVYEIEADTLYKGDLLRPQVEVSSRINSCGLQNLTTDRRYVFFVVEEGPDLTADTCGGTARATGKLETKVVSLLGEGDDLRPKPDPEPVVVEFTRVQDAEPETLTRLAAPGAALVLLGLLGLFVVRRATRRD